MDASDIIRRNLQAINAAAKVAAVKVTNPSFTATTVNKITNLSTMTFTSEDSKINFDAGMKYLYYDTAGIPYLSTMNFCSVRAPLTK
jgi:hypothetical protein